MGCATEFQLIEGRIGSVKTDCIPGRTLVWLDLGGGRGLAAAVLEIQFAAGFQYFDMDFFGISVIDLYQNGFSGNIDLLALQ